jgi:hypothetical protein
LFAGDLAEDLAGGAAAGDAASDSHTTHKLNFMLAYIYACLREYSYTRVLYQHTHHVYGLQIWTDILIIHERVWDELAVDAILLSVFMQSYLTPFDDITPFDNI